MSQNSDFDVGPLTWVKAEIDAALASARERLLTVQENPDQREPLRFAQSFVHQASGALSVVGLDGVTQFAESIDKLLSALAAGDSPATPENLALTLRAIGVLGNYINEVAAGAPNQPLRLFPVYQELASARGGDAPLPAKLFFPDLSARPQLERVAAIAPDRAAHELRVLRGRFEKGLLGWLRKPQEAKGPQDMLNAVARIEQIQSQPATRTFWWAAIAFFEGLVAQAIPADRDTQRLCRRIDAQMRRLLEGSQIIAERLVRDVLYHVGTARTETRHAQAVRQAFQLDQIIPGVDAELSDTLRQPHVLRVRETLDQSKEAWNRFSAGAAIALPQFQEQLSELVRRTEPMRLSQVTRLLETLAGTVAWLRADPLRQSDDLSMEIATSLLVVEQAVESPNADQAMLRRQVDLLCGQFDARREGQVVVELDLTPFGEVSRRAQERLFFNQLAREILTNLGQIEQTLDAFFRNPDLRETLPALAAPLKQIEGAFAVLGETRAVALVQENTARIQAFATEENLPAPEEFDTLAHQLSALGFYVDALKNGPARLEDFIEPRKQQEEEEEVPAGETLELQLQREAEETRNLAAALKDAPQDEALRQQLVSNLESLRDDAQLVADAALEQRAREALSSLKAGGSDVGELVTRDGGAVVEAPQPSAETTRLISASSEELDAELLAIFLEEAHEVLATIAEHRNLVAAGAHDFDALTTVRRGFHTLKGSSRMVGLGDFSEAARHVEMTLNRWLQLEKDATPELIALLDCGVLTFGAWVEQLEGGGSPWRDAAELIAQAQRLLSSLDGPGDDDGSGQPNPAVVLPVGDSGMLDASLTATALAPLLDNPTLETSSELDLTSTLLELDLAALPSGEQGHTEIDLSVTDFEGDVLRAFSEEFGETKAAVASADNAQRFLPPGVSVDGDFDFDLGELAEDSLPEKEGAIPSEADRDDVELTLPELVEEVPEEAAAAELDLTESQIGGVLEGLVAEREGNAEFDLTATDLAIELQREEESVDFPQSLGLPLIEDLLLDEQAPAEQSALADEARENPQDGATAGTQEVKADEITIGDQVLSRGLYDLYVAESRQLLDVLLDEHGRLAGNPLRYPSVDSIRAAHTLAGISGTARIEPAYALGKALEHALHRFADPQVAPEPVQTDLLVTVILTLDGMLGEVLLLQMPEDTPDLIEQLRALQPSLGEQIPVADLPVVTEVPIAAVPTHEEGEQPAATDSGDERAPVETPETLEIVTEVSALNVETIVLPEAPTPDNMEAAPADELDEQLLPIFFEEANELIETIAATLREMRAAPTEAEPALALARSLHTLKGSARMAGAMRLGQYVHNLEGYLEMADARGQPHGVLVDDLESGLDHVVAMIERLRHPEQVAAAESAQTPVELNAETDSRSADIPAQDVTASRPQVAPQFPLDELEAAQPAQRAPLRVRAELIDRFVNEAGEISIARTRIEGEMRVLRRSLLDLTENVIRLRNQLREVEIQAESQMQSRIAAAEAQHANFDPLEFDRFTRLQELTRMMAESVGDVTTIQQNQLRNLDAADSALHAQGRLSRDLQQALMGVRMVPFEELADRLYRIVRQTAKELGKRANLDIQGGAIEIDRGVLDKMTAPIEHLLRNAVAHGIELPEQRAGAGKPEFGQITLKLTQLSNEIALELADDGRGLDYQRILARGREAGLLGPNETPGENRLTQLIFEPGFSTAQQVSGIAGRGVGMDVVKNETLSVGGRIEVFSEAGKGSRFMVHLPLTLAVTQALLVRSGERTYAVPSNMVEQALELKEAALADIRARGFVEWKDTQYPLAYMPRLLGNPYAQPAQSRFHWVLLVRAGSQRLAVLIDELRGNQEIVVKNAGPQFVRLQGYSGATVLADGEISLILNPVALAAWQSTATAPLDGKAAELDEQPLDASQTRIPSVMVVDDSLTVRKITSRLLEREGFHVVTAKDGVDALEQLTEYKPDVMLLDIEMPRMDGFDLARNVRADARLKDVPIITITSRMADKHRNYAMEIGVNHYLGKPYQEEQLLELITGFIAAQRA
ncbi:MAG: hybrid sensor histidine kinase/response regulator [Candidatus Dactylopiibacterium carminicum]|nr:MAG: hybrid sensor histidine kinase/response regulator [Candidatus Dactylopiibacterium carminicum]